MNMLVLNLADWNVKKFDTVLSGTDKLIYLAPPEGKTWVVMYGGVYFDNPSESPVHWWVENAPYQPYRNPFTNELQDCHCATFQIAEAGRNWFPLEQPVIVAWPNRLMFGIEHHGSLAGQYKAWADFAIVERDTLAPPSN